MRTSRWKMLSWGSSLCLVLACGPSPVSSSPPDVAEDPGGSRDETEAPPARPTPSELEGVARSYASDLAREPHRTDWSGGDAERGRALYRGNCVVCHGTEGAGDGLGAVALNPKPRDFRDGTYYLDANANNETGEDVDLARVILEGPAAFGGSDAMVAWKDALSEDEVRDLVAYLRTLER